MLLDERSSEVVVLYRDGAVLGMVLGQENIHAHFLRGHDDDGERREDGIATGRGRMDGAKDE